jgi:hypothetical protein
MTPDLWKWFREAKVVELRIPKPGFRHQHGERLVTHRFPIQGGLTMREAWVRSMSRPNPLLKLWTEMAGNDEPL